MTSSRSRSRSWSVRTDSSRSLKRRQDPVLTMGWGPGTAPCCGQSGLPGAGRGRDKDHHGAAAALKARPPRAQSASGCVQPPPFPKKEPHTTKCEYGAALSAAWLPWLLISADCPLSALPCAAAPPSWPFSSASRGLSHALATASTESCHVRSPAAAVAPSTAFPVQQSGCAAPAGLFADCALGGVESSDNQNLRS